MRNFYLPHDRVMAPHSDELVTKQECKDECDIHNILRQYQRTGIMAHIAANQPRFEDLPELDDFQSALNLVMDAEDRFALLPSQVRDRFENDPGQFLAAFQDPSMRDELRSLGLLREAPAPREPDPNPSGLPAAQPAPASS